MENFEILIITKPEEITGGFVIQEDAIEF